ncbi:hypothetical protein COV18_07510 [Candidatus Woesearchaeota archaeon CG10_big_fil_rev_8_21_14_0_10_37_12]|nr:MAG: hypothetical protein COV18_07510 [Candidatus Woesearchaeota archaeon CG10_big_fil_rev_8_21_14_0_10_37_12]
MKKILVLLLLLVPLAHAEVVIYQVLYDPITSESGGEAIELKNLGRETIDISGWIISTESSETDATIPEDSFLQSGQTYLVADANWNERKDDPSWRAADHEEAITLGNKESWVELRSIEDVKDRVSWETFDVNPGQSLTRVQKTGDLAQDLVVSQAEFFAGIPVPLTADITLTVPQIIITEALRLNPDATLVITNNGDSMTTITLNLNDLHYKNNTISKEHLSIDGPITFVVDAHSEYRAKISVRPPANILPGVYTSSIRVIIEE